MLSLLFRYILFSVKDVARCSSWIIHRSTAGSHGGVATLGERYNGVGWPLPHQIDGAPCDQEVGAPRGKYQEWQPEDLTHSLGRPWRPH